MSRAKVSVLETLLRDPDAPHYGYALMRQTGVKSGSLYPILDQLEKCRWLVARWESPADVTEGLPPRRWYRLTDTGKRLARPAIESYLARQYGTSPAKPIPGVAQ
ncbi:MAG: helix-turn-helix transcriptional regulator [Patulibacter sp.]|nr:helix-turn-helix transcriptional regulator [Patulibacter sp.]